MRSHVKQLPTAIEHIFNQLSITLVKLVEHYEVMVARPCTFMLIIFEYSMLTSTIMATSCQWQIPTFFHFLTESLIHNSLLFQIFADNFYDPTQQIEDPQYCFQRLVILLFVLLSSFTSLVLLNRTLSLLISKDLGIHLIRGTVCHFCPSSVLYCTYLNPTAIVANVFA